MLKLEDIQDDLFIDGIEPSGPVQVIRVKPSCPDAVNLTYESADGEPRRVQLTRDDEARLSLATKGLAWSFDASPEEFKLGAEALRRVHQDHHQRRRAS